MHHVSHLGRRSITGLALLAAIACLFSSSADLQADDVKLDVPYVPTPQDVVDKMLEIAKVKKDDVVWDLGCGDGRIPVTAAKAFGCKAMGFDIDPKRVEEAVENVKKNKLEELVKIEKKNIFDLDLSKEPTVITLYLLPTVNDKLLPQLMKCKAGTRIVSHSFDIEGMKGKETRFKSKDSGREHVIYSWVMPPEKK